MVQVAAAVLLLAMQQDPASDQEQLFSRILAAEGPAATLELVDEFARRFPDSTRVAEVYMIGMGVHQLRNRPAEVIEYGEKAIRADPDSLQALVTVSRQYAVEGRNLGRAKAMAQRALRVIARVSDDSPPTGYDPATWRAFLIQSRDTAEGTITYIDSVT